MFATSLRRRTKEGGAGNESLRRPFGRDGGFVPTKGPRSAAPLTGGNLGLGWVSGVERSQWKDGARVSRALRGRAG